MKRHTRLPLGLNVLVFEVQDILSSQIGQVGVYLGEEADICGNDGLRWYTGLEVIHTILRVGVGE